MFEYLIKELKEHLPFTVFGAFTGIILLIVFNGISYDLSYSIFYTLHPMHVFLSAFVTTSMYKLQTGKINGFKDLSILFVIGYVGSIGIATLSDSIIPYFGEILLNLPNSGAHIGFIEEWWIVNPLAFLGIILAYIKPFTKFPHSGHVLLSTWASLFHILMSLNGTLSTYTYLLILLFLTIAVWVPCCTSDIIFPMLFVNKKENR